MLTPICSRRRIGKHNTIRALLLLIGLMLSLSQRTVAQGDNGTSQAVIKWLASNAIPLPRVEPGDRLGDLQPLKRILQGVRVVGLGEATHGAHEFFQFKHRVIQFLVTRMNFRVLAIETGYGSTSDINDYVLGKSRDGAKALENQGFWVFDTEEMRSLLDWLRSYNLRVRANKKVKVVGFDIHYNDLAKQKLLTYIKRMAPERAADVEAVFRIDPAALLEAAYFTKDKQERAEILVKLRDARPRYDELLGFLTLNEMRFTNLTSMVEFRQMHEYARVLAQLANSSAQPLDVADGPLRDYYMAENIKRLVDAEPRGTRMILWAHNQHVSTGQESESYPYMGFHLRRFFGRAYYALGFSFNRGSFQARDFSPKGNRALMQFTIGPAPKGSIDWYFAQTGMKNYLVDFRHAARDPTVAEWLAAPHPMRIVGSYYTTQAEKNYFIPTILKRDFDGIVFFDQTSRAHPNQSVKNVAATEQ